MRRIIARGLLLGCLLLVVAGCSALRLAYNQAPTLAYWWIDGYADLDDPQSVRLRSDLEDFFAWHRQTELPTYLSRLQRWQDMAANDTQPEKAYAEYQFLRSAYLRMIERSLEPAARLALSLSPAQLQHLQRKYDKNNREFESLYLRVDEEERIDNLVDRALERYEPLYGSLSDGQLDLLREHIRRSPFDARRVNEERLRRQSDLMATLRSLRADPQADLPRAVAALRQWHDRVLRSPLPDFPGYSETLVRNACDQFATLHNSMTPQQRAHAVRVLKDYETDLRSLLPPL